MRYLTWFLFCSLALAAVSPCPLWAQGQATLLEPISDTDVKATNSFIAATANEQGQVMAVFYGKRGRAHADCYLVSLLGAGGAWQQTDLPLPADRENYYAANNFYGMAWHGNKFALLFRMSGRYYHVTWSGGAWATPQQLPRGEDAGSINFDADGNLIFYHRGDREFHRLLGNDLQTVKLPSKLDNPGASDSIYRGRNGAVHIMGVGAHYVPTVASVPAGVDPMQPGNWMYQPAPGDGYTAAVGYTMHEKRIVLDWPRQTVWASWEASDKLYVSHAPIGATTEAAWSTWEIEPPEGGKIVAHCLAASDGGSVAVAYMELPPKTSSSGAGRYRKLYFRWLLPNGLGEELPLLRPGTDTEAAQFSELSISSMNLIIGPNSVAHFFIKGKKRGEWPANLERVYYSRITGGAVLAAEPGVAGGGQTVATGEGQEPGETGPPETGGKPDLVASVEFRYEKEYILRDGERIRRYTRSHNTVRPEITITNNGAEYYGDLWADITVDGAVVHYHVADETNHMRPMLERGASKTLYKVPGFEYEFKVQDGWEPPVLQVEHSHSAPTVHMHPGLGRKQLKIIVDPDNKIAEENEDNNVTEAQYEISDGREDADRIDLTTVKGKRQRSGYNDLAILGTPMLYANTPIAAPGLVQRPAEARLIVGNPRGARFFLNVPVVALLDGQEVWRHTIDFMDDTRHLYNKDTQWFGYTGAARRRGPEVMGGFLDVPVDLTNAAVGNHTLTLIVDPEDQFADLDRDNNSANIQFRVREPGGTLRVEVRDRQTQASIGLAHVLLEALYFGVADANGLLVIPDVPAGNYQPQDLWGSRLWYEPRYAMQSAIEGFTVIKGQDTTARLALEPPVQVAVEVTDQQTGEPVPEPLSGVIGYIGDGLHSRGWGESALAGDARPGEIRFHDVAPGLSKITLGAYAFESVTGTHDIHADDQGECHLEVTLPRKLRGEIIGTVVDADGRAVRDVLVWLNGAPRASATDNDGNFTLTEVEAGRNYQVMARKEGYVPDEVMSGTVQADQIRSLLLRMPKAPPRTSRLSSGMPSLSVDCVAWAQVESWPGFSFGPIGSDSYDVSAEHGKFSATMAMLYRDIQGEDNIMVDSIILGTVGKEFWSENITYSYSLASVISSGISKVAGKDIARLVSLISPINDTWDFINGDTDPSQMSGGEVCGSFSSQTGAEYNSVSLIPMPSIEFSPGMSGGQTVVRTDILEVSDGLQTKRIRRQWYSPQTAVYNLGEKMALDQLEIRFYVAVLNERLSPGPLYASSRNVIKWRPMEDKWLRFEPCAYDALPPH